jgi:hypothetical protein
MAKRLTWMGALLVCAATTAARAEDDDVLVVPVEPDGDVAPTAAAADDVRAALVRRGVGVLARPETRLEQVAPVQSVARLPMEIGTMARALWAARNLSRPAEVADLALRLRPYLDALRAAPLDDEIRGECGKRCSWSTSVRDALVAACIDGAEALEVTGRLGEGHDLIAACADLPWLTALPTSLKPVYGALRRSAELRVNTAPAGLSVSVAGEVAVVQELRPLQVRDGGRFPVTASCPEAPRRVHWVEVAAGARELAVTIDCDLDVATHVDAHGLWLSSSAYAAVAHARALGRAVVSGQVLTVDRNSGRFRLQLRSVEPSDGGASVTLPIGYSSRQLERAVDGLFTAKAASAPVATALGAPVVTPPSSSSATPWAVWSGAALLVAGAGLDVAAWAVERHRSARADALYGQLVLIPSSQDRWISLRPAILRLGGSVAAVGAAGAALLVAGLPDEATPWWAAGTAAAVGAGLGAWGAAELSQGRLCSGEDMRQCAPHEAQRDRGAVLMATAAPFLAVPLTKLVRLAWSGSRHETVAVSVAAQGLRVSGRW